MILPSVISQQLKKGSIAIQMAKGHATGLDGQARASKVFGGDHADRRW